MSSTRRQIALIAAPAALLAGLAFAPHASAEVYCVPDNTVHGSCVVAQADLQTALNSADANAGNDTVRIGAGTFTAGTSNGFTYLTGAGNVSIIGSGEAQTTLATPADPGDMFYINHALLLDASGGGSSISDLTVSLPTPSNMNMFGSQYRAVELAAGQVDHVTVTEPATVINSYGFWVNPGTTTIDNSTVNFPAPGGQTGVITNSGGDVHIEDSTITALRGFSLRAAGVTNSIKRTTINLAANGYGVGLEDGTLNLESSVIDLRSTSGIGAQSAGAGGPDTATLNLDHATLVGTNPSATGLQLTANDGAAADNLTATLTNSVIDGVVPIKRQADNGDTANITTNYSNYSLTGIVDSNGGSGMGGLVHSNRTEYAPGFVSPGTGDYHLMSNSLLVDLGDPTALGPGLDIDGQTRAQEGPDGICPSASDIGADEVMGSALLDCLPPDTSITSGPAGGSTITTNTAAFGFTSTETPATFQCSVDGGAFSACSTPFTTPVLTDGTHSFSVRASDMSANQDPTPASRSFTVDTTVPVVPTPILLNPAQATPAPTPTKKCKKKKRAAAAKKCRRKK